MRFRPPIPRIPHIPTSLTGAAACWALLVGGMLLLAAVVLTPAWLECNELRWQHETLSLQARSLAEQAQAYRQFHHALTSGDPVVIERLAYTELGLKPAGATPFLTGAAVSGGPDITGNIASWLHRPVPRVGIDLPAYQPVHSVLTQVTTTDPARVAVMIAALACLIAGIFLPTNPSRRFGQGPTP